MHRRSLSEPRVRKLLDANTGEVVEDSTLRRAQFIREMDDQERLANAYDEPHSLSHEQFSRYKSSLPSRSRYDPISSRYHQEISLFPSSRDDSPIKSVPKSQQMGNENEMGIDTLLQRKIVAEADGSNELAVEVWKVAGGNTMEVEVWQNTPPKAKTETSSTTKSELEQAMPSSSQIVATWLAKGVWRDASFHSPLACPLLLMIDGLVASALVLLLLRLSASPVWSWNTDNNRETVLNDAASCLVVMSLWSSAHEYSIRFDDDDLPHRCFWILFACFCFAVVQMLVAGQAWGTNPDPILEVVFVLVASMHLQIALGFARAMGTEEHRTRGSIFLVSSELLVAILWIVRAFGFPSETSIGIIGWIVIVWSLFVAPLIYGIFLTDSLPSGAPIRICRTYGLILFTLALMAGSMLQMVSSIVSLIGTATISSIVLAIISLAIMVQLVLTDNTTDDCTHATHRNGFTSFIWLLVTQTVMVFSTALFAIYAGKLIINVATDDQEASLQVDIGNYNPDQAVFCFALTGFLFGLAGVTAMHNFSNATAERDGSCTSCCKRPPCMLLFYILWTCLIAIMVATLPWLGFSSIILLGVACVALIIVIFLELAHENQHLHYFSFYHDSSISRNWPPKNPVHGQTLEEEVDCFRSHGDSTSWLFGSFWRAPSIPLFNVGRRELLRRLHVLSAMQSSRSKFIDGFFVFILVRLVISVVNESITPTTFFQSTLAVYGLLSAIVQYAVLCDDNDLSHRLLWMVLSGVLFSLCLFDSFTGTRWFITLCVAHTVLFLALVRPCIHQPKEFRTVFVWQAVLQSVHSLLWFGCSFAGGAVVTLEWAAALWSPFVSYPLLHALTATTPIPPVGCFAFFGRFSRLLPLSFGFLLLSTPAFNAEPWPSVAMMIAFFLCTALIFTGDFATALSSDLDLFSAGRSIAIIWTVVQPLIQASSMILAASAFQLASLSATGAPLSSRGVDLLSYSYCTFLLTTDVGTVCQKRLTGGGSGSVRVVVTLLMALGALTFPYLPLSPFYLLLTLLGMVVVVFLAQTWDQYVTSCELRKKIAQWHKARYLYHEDDSCTLSSEPTLSSLY